MQQSFIDEFAKNPSVDNRLGELIHRFDYLTRTKKLKTISVFSELPQEGKSYFILNMAFYMGAIYKKRVLIVDLNLFGDSLLERIRKVENPVLNEDSFIIPTIYENVSILELQSFKIRNDYDESVLLSELGVAIDEFRKHYDLILINTKSPIPNKYIGSFVFTADSSIIIKSKKTFLNKKYRDVENMIKTHEIDLLGIVYNQKKSL